MAKDPTTIEDTTMDVNRAYALGRKAGLVRAWLELDGVIDPDALLTISDLIAEAEAML